MSDFCFTKTERIRKRSDFIAIYNKGEKRQTQHFQIITYPNALPWRRLGVTVGKKIGSAVQRNHVKRILREYFRLNKTTFPASSDIIIIAKIGAAKLKYSELSKELSNIVSF